jgi:hypothetical protein
VLGAIGRLKVIRNSIYKFYSAYVHEFEDKSVLLVITEHTKIEPKNIEDYREFVWTPKIESIERPVHHIGLQGVITTIHSNSGLVRRCNKCKERAQVEAYINTLVGSLPRREQKLIVEGCPSNPRKIKRILNLAYFLTKGTEESLVEKYFPFLVIWSIATIAFPDLASIVKDSPIKSLVQMSLMAYHIGEIEQLLRKLPAIKIALEQNSTFGLSDSLSMSYKNFDPTTMRGLEYASRDPKAFDFLKAIATHSSIFVPNDTQANLERVLEGHYDTTGKIMSDVIYQGGLVA